MPIRNQMRIVKVVAFIGLLSLATAAGPIGALAVPHGAGASSYRGRNLESLVVERVAPKWPPEPHMVVDGDVVVRIHSDTHGMLRSARAVSGHPLKIAAAIAAVRKWKFRPLIERRKARTVTGIVTVRFPASATAIASSIAGRRTLDAAERAQR